MTTARVIGSTLRRWPAVGMVGIVLLALACVRFSVAAASNVTLRLELQQGHPGEISAAGFSADGRLLAIGGGRGAVTLWEVPSGRRIYQVHGDWDPITGVTLTPDELIVTGRRGTTPSRFQLATGKPAPKNEQLLDSCAGASVVLVSRGTGGMALQQSLSGRLVASFDFAAHQLAPITRVTLTCSSDGRKALLAIPDRSGRDVAQLWDVPAAKPLGVFAPPDAPLRVAALSPDGRVVATAGQTDRAVHLWSTDDHQLVRVMTEYDEYTAAQVNRGTRTKERAKDSKIWALDFSPDGRLLAAAGDVGILVWEVGTGKPVHIIDDGSLAGFVRFAPDSRTLLAALGAGDRLSIFEAEGREPAPLTASLLQTPLLARRCYNRVTIAALPICHVPVVRTDLSSQLASDTTWVASPDGRYIASVSLLGGPGGTWFSQQVAGKPASPIPYIDLRTGREERWQFQHPVTSLAFTVDSRRIYFGLGNGCVISWDISGHAAISEFCGPSSPVTAVAVSADQKVLIIGHRDGSRRQIDLATRLTTALRPHRNYWSDDLQLSPDGSFLLDGLSSTNGVIVDLTHSRTLPQAGEVRLVDRRTDTTKATVKVKYRSNGIAAFSPDGAQFAISNGDTVVVYESDSVKKLRELEESAFARRVAVSADGRKLAIATLDGDLGVWDLPSGRRLWSRGRFDDGAVTRLQFISGDERLLVSMGNSSARIIDTSDGSLFLTLAVLRGGDWVTVAPDGRFDANLRPGEAPMQWIASTLPLSPLPLGLFMRDSFEPRLLARAIASEHFPPARNPADLNLLRPVVRIREVRESETRHEALVRVEVIETSDPETGRRSGAKSVRLLRDGRLVASTPDDQPITLLEGRAIVEFPRVRTRPDTVERLAVYAFNAEGISSEVASYNWSGHLEPTSNATRREPHEIVASRVPSIGRRAWLLNIGVNITGVPSLNLRYAANDARVLGDVLSKHLQRTGQFEGVSQVSVISDETARNGASKAAIRSAFTALATRGAAGPNIDDLVIISFSGHGFRSPDGRFFILPSSVTGPINSEQLDPAQLMTESISNDELSVWLRDVDAQIVLIIDACYSGASIASAGFKPGPFGAGGLGQLAYDKRITVLAAAEPDGVAIESGNLRQGLLTYALTQFALQAGEADWMPRDGRIRLHEWLRYAVARVPRLADEIAEGKFDSRDGSRVIDERGLRIAEPEQERAPTLFAFADEILDPVVAGDPDPELRPPEPVREVPAEYPAAARAKGLRGMVGIEVTVDETGRVSAARVVRSIPLFDAAALRAARQWIFKPATIGGKPVPMMIQLNIPFAPPSR